MSSHKYCASNCGGTDCDATAVYTSTPKCKHENGAFLDVTFWILTKEIFYCSDCYTQFSAKEIRGQIDSGQI